MTMLDRLKLWWQRAWVRYDHMTAYYRRHR
jgi:hypothetical protein